MKNHIAFKFLAILLCALTLLTALLSVAAIVVMEKEGLYELDLEQRLQYEKEEILENIASDIAVRYASDYLGGCDLTVIRGYYGEYIFSYYLRDEHLAWDILDETGKVLYKSPHSGAGWTAIEVPVTWGSYLRMVEPGTPTDIPLDGDINDSMVEPTEGDSDAYYFPDAESGLFVEYDLVHEDMPAWKVVLYLQRDAWKDGYLYEALVLLWQQRYNLFWALGISLLLFAMGAVYLCCAAGRKPGSDEIKAGGFNALPLDLYAALAFFFVSFCFLICIEIYQWFDTGVIVTLLGFLFLAFACCLVFVAFCFACAAQFKEGNGRWWRGSAIGFAILTSWDLAVKTVTQWLPAFGRWAMRTGKVAIGFVLELLGISWNTFAGALKWIWSKVSGIFWWLGRKASRVYSLLPVTWQWILVGFVLVAILFLGLLFAQNYHSSGWGLLFCLGLCLAVVLYGAHAFGILLEGTKRMGSGNLDAKVSDRLLLGAFRDFAEDLNALADVAKEAARKEMKSERMKSELITNVSHDIKTPLTSIINYVDLLQKPHTPEEERQYLEVLGRKSEQLKKLIQDLMEMSKASTGNMAVELTQVDAVETVTQALGEFSDKLAQRRLTVVFAPPAEKVLMRADGRLAWRVLNNLLSNAVNYALPGTRLYVNLSATQNHVQISLKNVSAEPLNVDAEELMERFVRGDASRNSDGSGLGLNIARSLMEVQGGSLILTVDGDLFKATMIFPKV